MLSNFTQVPAPLCMLMVAPYIGVLRRVYQVSATQHIPQYIVVEYASLQPLVAGCRQPLALFQAEYFISSM